MDGSLSATLLEWYDRNARDLPWRAAPGTNRMDPYRVWLSEVMLQQTTVAAVIPYFEKFIARWPDVRTLAATPDEEIMAAWAGLGYYSRARNLIAFARAVAERGRFPQTEDELRKLPGLGAYTSAAIAAIAFGERAIVVDANVERVVARLFYLEESLPGVRKAIRRETDGITPDLRAGDFAQAMMDLGATICTSRDPKCMICPLSEHCLARKNGDPARLPVKAPKREKPVRQGTAFWLERAGQVWLERRADKGMLGGMRALPDDGWKAGEDGSGRPPVAGQWRVAGKVRHSFSHFDLELAVAVSGDADSLPEGTGEWWPIDRLEQAGLPTAFAKAAQLARAQR